MKENWLLVAAGAGIVGLLLGYAMGAGGSNNAEVNTAIGERLDKIESRLAALDSLESANTGIADLASANETILNELQGVKNGLGGLASGFESLPESFEALSSQISSVEGGSEALSENVAAALSQTSTAVEGVTSELQEVARRFAALNTEAVSSAAPEAAGDASADVAAEAAADPDAEMRAAIGEDGLVLGVGQTGVAGEQRLFLSKLDEQAAQLVVVGGDRVSLGVFDGPMRLDNGCDVRLHGVHERHAYLEVSCS